MAGGKYWQAGYQAGESGWSPKPPGNYNQEQKNQWLEGHKAGLCPDEYDGDIWHDLWERDTFGG